LSTPKVKTSKMSQCLPLTEEVPRVITLLSPAVYVVDNSSLDLGSFTLETLVAEGLRTIDKISYY
jgi:hypothetical protein